PPPGRPRAGPLRPARGPRGDAPGGRRGLSRGHGLTGCNIAFRTTAGAGIEPKMPTPGAGADTAAGHVTMDMTRRGNYDSGEDFVLEYGEVRVQFNTAR